MPGGADTKEFAEMGQFLGDRESADGGDMDADKIDQAILDQHFPFGLIDEEFAHGDRDRGRFAHAFEPANVLRREWILKEEETELLQFFSQINGEDGLNALVDIVQEFEFVTDLGAQVIEEARND